MKRASPQKLLKKLVLVPGGAEMSRKVEQAYPHKPSVSKTGLRHRRQESSGMSAADVRALRGDSLRDPLLEGGGEFQ